MQEWMRKHRRIIMFFILVFIGIPFVFVFGMPRTGSQQEQNRDISIAEVGGVPLMASEFRRYLDNAASQRARSDQEKPTYRDLDADGTAQRVLEQMIDAALIKVLSRERNFSVKDSMLAEQMKRWEMFQDENKKFNKDAWNEWIGTVKDWNPIYEELRNGIAQQLFLDTIAAPASWVLDSKIEEELLADHTKLRIKYAKVELPYTPSEEELKKHYDENPETYRLPEQQVADVIAVSLDPEMPELAGELVKRARDGEDFAALASQYSNLSMPEGGDLGWMNAEETVAPHLMPLFELGVGEVSEAISGPTGFFIYKNEEERISETTGAREVHARQIVLNTSLDEEIKAQREQTANEIAAKLQAENADPAAIAAEYGVALKQTSPFDRNSTEIDAVTSNDVFTFRAQCVAQKETPWKPIPAKNNIYLSKIVESRQGAIPPFEDVQEKVAENVINEHKRTDAYKEQLSGYVTQFEGKVNTIDDIKTVFPELEVISGETPDLFARKDMLFQQQVYVQTEEIFKAVKDQPVGKIAGPLTGFFGDTWFVELLERVEPSEEEYAALKDERNQIRDRLAQTARYEIISDYTKDLRERMLAQVPYKQNTAVLDEILGRNWQEPEQSNEGEEEAVGEGELANAASSDPVTEIAAGETAKEEDIAADAQDGGGEEDNALPLQEGELETAQTTESLNVQETTESSAE